MHFDGQTALFSGDVRSTINDGEENAGVRCRQMGVTLSRPFSFSQDRKDQEQPEVETIDCWGGVHFDSKTTEDDKLMEKRVGFFAQLHVRKPTGKTDAEGPGFRRLAVQPERAIRPLAVYERAVKRPPERAEEDQGNTCRSSSAGTWRVISGRCCRRRRVHPAHPRRPRWCNRPTPGGAGRGRSGGPGNSILGANGAWTTIFHDHVEVLYGPVEDYNVMVSRDYLQDRAGYLSCDTLRVDQHPVSATTDQYLTMRPRETAALKAKISSANPRQSATTAQRRNTFSAATATGSPACGGNSKSAGNRAAPIRNQNLLRPGTQHDAQDAMSKLDWVR